jgi:proteasome beta subunit
MALTTAGTVSDVQLLVKLIKAEIALKKVRTGREATVKETANLLGGLIYSNIRKMSLIPGISHFILAGSDKEGFHMYDLFADGSVTDIKDYDATGSGSVTAYGVFEALYKKDSTVKDGVKLAVRAINAALQRDIATGDGLDVVTITSKGVKFVLEKEIDTTIKG